MKVGGTRGSEEVRGTELAGRSPPFLSRYRETCLALESVAESSAAVSKPRCVWLRVLVVYDLKEAVRLPTRVQE